MTLTATATFAAPVFLGVSTAEAEARPLGVMAGQKKEFVLTLTATGMDHPQLSADLAAVAGGIAAPLLSGLSPELRRVGEARAGVQRFNFFLEIPAAARKQLMLLRLKVRPSATGEWLPLPAVMLQATPQTWKETLRLFAQQVPSGRLTGSEKLHRLFQQAEIDLPEAPDGETVGDASVRAWFAEASGNEFRVPEAPRSVWVIFKKNARGGLELWRPAPQAPPCVAVEADILDRLDSDPAAQELFEHALAMARTLTLSSSDSAQSQP